MTDVPLRSTGNASLLYHRQTHLSKGKTEAVPEMANKAGKSYTHSV